MLKAYFINRENNEKMKSNHFMTLSKIKYVLMVQNFKLYNFLMHTIFHFNTLYYINTQASIKILL